MDYWWVTDLPTVDELLRGVGKIGFYVEGVLECFWREYFWVTNLPCVTAVPESVPERVLLIVYYCQAGILLIRHYIANRLC